MSKKRSSTSDAKPPEQPPVFYLDENLSSPEIGKTLRRFQSDWTIILHHDQFKRGARDPDVIRACAAQGWTMISCDDRIRYVPENKKVAIESKLRAFMGNYQGVEIASALVAARHRMIGFNKKNAPPFFARIFINGTISRLDDKRESGQLSARERTLRKYGANVLNEAEGA